MQTHLDKFRMTPYEVPPGKPTVET